MSSCKGRKMKKEEEEEEVVLVTFPCSLFFTLIHFTFEMKMGVGHAFHKLCFANMSIFPSFSPPCNVLESLASRWESSRKFNKLSFAQIRV
jgi:hypothetical protein